MVLTVISRNSFLLEMDNVVTGGTKYRILNSTPLALPLLLKTYNVEGEGVTSLPSNPFTPMRAATLPEEFFGRHQEISVLKRSIEHGNIAIQGSIGIGKSSLLERLRQIEEGFAEGHPRAFTTHAAVGNAEVGTLDEAANLILKRMVAVDQRQTNHKFSFSKWVTIGAETTETTSFFPPGRRLDVLERLLLQAAVEDPTMLVVLAFDEADKCPIPLARLFRSIVTFCDLNGLRNVRLAVAGVNPYFQAMVEEDSGISRFFSTVINLLPMPEAEAAELVETKLDAFCCQPDKDISYDPDLITSIVGISGGHPHLLQFLGFRAIEHELQDPDGNIDRRDLVGALQRICYEDRKPVYDSILHSLEVHGKLGSLRDLFSLASGHCPTTIPRREAIDRLGAEALEWFVNNNILAMGGSDQYRLIDEFLRIRMLLDDSESRNAVEHRLVFDEGVRVEDIADESDVDESLDEEEEAFLPELKVELSNSSPSENEDIVLDVFARSEAGITGFLNSDYDQIIVVIIDSTDHTVAKEALHFDSEVSLESGRWSHVASVTLAGQAAGDYRARPQIRVAEEGRKTRWFGGHDLDLEIRSAPDEHED